MDVKQYKGFKPFTFQRDVIDELCTPEMKGKGKTVIVKSSRQRGKSFMISNILLYYSINFKRSKNFCVTPTLKQAKEIYKTITNAIGESGLIKSSNATDLYIRLINGSNINFKSAEQGDENLRGYTCDGILCIDECAFIDDDIFNVILPWVDFHKANILMTSTPFLKSGFFYKYFNYGLEKKHNCISIDWCNEKYAEEMLKVMPLERLEMYKQTLPKNTFKTEYLGEWLDDDGTVFLNLNSCLKSKEIANTDKLYVGIDWGNGGDGDYTVVSAFNQDGEQVLLHYFNNLSPLHQIDRIVEILNRYLMQIVVIQTELNAIGTPYTELLRNRSHIYNNKVKGFTTSNTSKNTIVVNFQTALEKNEASLLPDEKQKREFGYFTATYNPKTRNVSYAAPVGLHDDCVMATLIAYDGLLNGVTTGSYCFSFPKKK